MLPPEEIEAMRQTIAEALGLSGAGCRDEAAAEGYRYALNLTWDRMQMVVGTDGAAAIVRHAIGVASKRHPQVAMVTANGHGLDLSPLENGPADEENSRCESLEELCLATFQTLVELTGQIVAGQILEEMREWRRGSGRK